MGRRSEILNDCIDTGSAIDATVRRRSLLRSIS